MNRFNLLVSSLGLSLLITACGGSDKHHGNSSSSAMMSSAMMSSASSADVSSAVSSSSMPAMVEMKYSISITNLTAGQPLSPPAYVVHGMAYKPFTLGMSASVGVEKLAESGDASDFLAEAAADEATLTDGQADAGIMPGASGELTFSAMVEDGQQANLYVSILSMLGNTNDGFTALPAQSIGTLAIGESWSFNTLSYDAGTEMNTETQATVPGPAANGEGFNSARDDISDQVSLHPGVVSKDDGNTASALSGMQRWDNPVAHITITRLAP